MEGARLFCSRTTAFYTGIVVFLVVVAWRVWEHPHVVGDTGAVITWTRNALACIDAGQYTSCDSAGHFPAFQYFSTALMLKFGMASDLIGRSHARFSFVAFCWIIGIFLATTNRLKNSKLQVLSVATLLASPLTSLAVSSFGEVPAAVITLLFAYTCLFERPAWQIIALGALVGFTKDTAWPFVMLLGLLCVIGQRRRKLVVVSAAAVAALVAAASFNAFKFATIYNVQNLVAFRMVPSVAKQLELFAALWIAPNGGLLLFVPGMTLMMWALVKIIMGNSSAQKKMLALGIIGTVSLLHLGLAKWWSPFGWIAWGPRLTMPWLPALTLVAVVRLGDEIAASYQMLLKRPKIHKALLAMFAVLAIPQMLVILDLPVLSVESVATTANCPNLPIIEYQFNEYYHCLHYWLWEPKRWLLKYALTYNLTTQKVSWLIFCCMLLLIKFINLSNARANPSACSAQTANTSRQMAGINLRRLLGLAT